VPVADVTAQWTAQAHASDLVLRTPRGQGRVTLQVPGRHMVMNALAAAAAAHAAGIGVDAIARGLAAFRPVAGRLVPRRGLHGSAVIDDSYNANPDSVRAAIDVLAAAPGERWLVLGDMGEVGEQGPAFHREVGAYARERGVARLYTAGALSREAATAFGPGAAHFESVETLATEVAANERGGVTVLVKGSRFMRMERVVRALTGADGGGH